MKHTKHSIILPSGEIIKRAITGKQLGNFNMLSVIYKCIKFGIGDGDEYMLGMPDTFKLSYPMLGTGKIRYVVYPNDEQLKRYAKSNPDGYITPEQFEQLFK